MSHHVMRTLSPTGLVFALLVLLSGCGSGGDGTTGPTTPVVRPGTLALRLVTPNPDDRAARIEIVGGPVTAVRAPAGTTMLATTTTTGAIVILVGDLRSGTVADVDIPDVSRIGGYSVSLVEVADARYALRPDLVTGYRAALER